MIRLNEDALICDLAETYHIYDYKQLPASLVAVFAIGLRENSRIKMLMGRQKVSLDTLLLAGIVDRLGILAWQKTKDGQNNRNRPKSLVTMLNGEEEERQEMVYRSGEEFEKAKAKILKGLEVDDGN